MKKGYKECPFCMNEIKNDAIKCQYCGEWFKEEEKKIKQLPENKESMKHEKKTSIVGVILPIVLIIVILIGLYYMINNQKKSDTWQGFYYPNGLSEGAEISGPIFNNYGGCKDWALDKYNKGNEAYCSKNCHDSIDGTPICEDVVRTWHPLPGFGTIFEGISEDRPGPKNVCKKPENLFNKGDQFNKGYEHGKNGGKCDIGDEDFKEGCSFYLFDMLSYLSCLSDCGIYEEYGDEWFECLSESEDGRNFFNNLDNSNASSEINQNNTTKTGWLKYDKGGISFQYPEGLKISESNFNIFSYFNGINIHVKKYTYDTYLDAVSTDYGIWAMDRSEDELKDYAKQKRISSREALNSVRNGNWDGSKLCTYGCSETHGIIGTKKVKIGGINGLMNNYYFTQDPGLACFSEINTELLLVKDENTIYSIMFKYNFGSAYTFMLPYKDSDDEICIYHTYPGLAGTWNDDIEDFFGYRISSLKGKSVEPFEKTYDLINEIISTIAIK